MEKKITRKYLEKHPDEIFVFGDNVARIGSAGGAYLRDCTNTFGFITKKFPGNKDTDYYTPEEYENIYKLQLIKLKAVIGHNQDSIFLISKLGSGLANRFGIFDKIIEPSLKNELSKFENVRFLW